MGKISPVSAKYIVHTSIEIDGVVDKPDVIGAIFGQTEGLLGAELELRELQRSGRIGRIEVNLDTKTGKTKGEIIVPSSLDKAETAIIGAAFEIIQRIGPCNAKIKVENIEDVRVSKRNFVVERAKELLKKMMDTIMPDSQEIADEVAHSVRMMEIQEYGRDRLPAGPAIDESEEVIVVEGRADVMTLLKHGIKNAIAMNGSSVPQTIIDLSRKKSITIFVDGDRGGFLNTKELIQVADIDFITKAPDGKEVEELTKKEIHQALRNRIAAEQFHMEPQNHLDNVRKFDRIRDITEKRDIPAAVAREPAAELRERPAHMQRPVPMVRRPTKLLDTEKEKFREMLEGLVGTRGAYIVDSSLNILGKVPVTELAATIKSLGTGVHALIFDGTVDMELVEIAEKSRVQLLIGMGSSIKPGMARVNVLTADDLS